MVAHKPCYYVTECWSCTSSFVTLLLQEQCGCQCVCRAGLRQREREREGVMLDVNKGKAVKLSL